MSGKEYQNTTFVLDGKHVVHIWLQGIGWHPAKPLSDVKVGDILVYNYGNTSTVKEIRPTASGKSATLIVTDEKGQDWNSKARRLTTFVATKNV